MSVSTRSISLYASQQYSRQKNPSNSCSTSQLHDALEVDRPGASVGLQHSRAALPPVEVPGRPRGCRPRPRPGGCRGRPGASSRARRSSPGRARRASGCPSTDSVIDSTCGSKESRSPASPARAARQAISSPGPRERAPPESRPARSFPVPPSRRAPQRRRRTRAGSRTPRDCPRAPSRPGRSATGRGSRRRDPACRRPPGRRLAPARWIFAAVPAGSSSTSSACTCRQPGKNKRSQWEISSTAISSRACS